MSSAHSCLFSFHSLQQHFTVFLIIPLADCSSQAHNQRSNFCSWSFSAYLKFWEPQSNERQASCISDGCCSTECSPSKLYETQAILEKKKNTAACQSTLEFLKCHFIFVTIWAKSMTLYLFGVFLKCCCLRILLSTCQASLSWHKRVSLL